MPVIGKLSWYPWLLQLKLEPLYQEFKCAISTIRIMIVLFLPWLLLKSGYFKRSDINTNAYWRTNIILPLCSSCHGALASSVWEEPLFRNSGAIREKNQMKIFIYININTDTGHFRSSCRYQRWWQLAYSYVAKITTPNSTYYSFSGLVPELEFMPVPWNLTSKIQKSGVLFIYSLIRDDQGFACGFGLPLNGNRYRKQNECYFAFLIRICCVHLLHIQLTVGNGRMTIPAWCDSNIECESWQARQLMPSDSRSVIITRLAILDALVAWHLNANRLIDVSSGYY